MTSVKRERQPRRRPPPTMGRFVPTGPLQQDNIQVQLLIQDFITRTGESYSDIARRGDLPKQTVRRLHVRPLRRLPEPDTIARLAAGIQQPLAVVLVAAGYPPERDIDPEGRVFAMLYSELSEEDRAEIRRRMDFMREERREGRGGS